MASRSAAEGALSSGATEALERLYAAPLETFVARRREFAIALRNSGDPAGARRVMVTAKPSRTAWALNQVARLHPDLVKDALDARTNAAASAARSRADGETLRAGARAFRDRLAEVVEAAATSMRKAGAQLSPEQGRRIGATVQAVASGGDHALREALLAGRLTSDVEFNDPFAGLELGPAGPRAQSAIPLTSTAKAARETLHDAKRMREESHIRQAATRAREVQEARARIAILENEAKGARAHARKAETVAFRAHAEAERTRRAVEAIEAKLQIARRSLHS